MKYRTVREILDCLLLAEYFSLSRWSRKQAKSSGYLSVRSSLRDKGLHKLLYGAVHPKHREKQPMIPKSTREWRMVLEITLEVLHLDVVLVHVKVYFRRHTA